MRERNLLFGVLAVQLKLVTSQQLVKAGAVWAADQSRDLSEILIEQGVLAQPDRELLDKLIDRQIEAQAGDASLVLEQFGGDAAVHESFCGSIVFDAKGQAQYRSLGGEEAQEAEPAVRELSDAAQLTTEHPGRYSIKGEKGRGGIGRVLIAVDEHIGREIALKELLPESAAKTTPAVQSPMRRSATLTARFLREARVTGQLEHPGIVPVYEVGRRGDDTPYYTMKLVRGETLADRLKRCRGIGDRLKLLPHFLDLCQAIAYAHSRGVIHRDIKPANVMVGEFGETVLLDWGLAKVKGQKDEGAEKLKDEIKLLKEAGAAETVAGKPIGTPSYMSPEQADGLIDQIDERSDVWSLGAVLYEILTGKPPYTGVTALEVVGKVLSEEITPVLAAQKDAPAELSAVAERCLKRTHQERYASVEQLSDDVNAYLSGGMVSAYTYSTELLMRRWLKRNWAWIAAGFLVFFVLAAALMVVLAQYGEIVQQKQVISERNTELERQKTNLLVKSLNANASNLLQYRNDRWQTGMLLALQAGNFEIKQDGALSGNTATTQRDQIKDFPLSVKRLKGHENTASHVCFSPDGKLLASAGWDNTVRIWWMDDLEAEPQVLRGHEDYVGHVCFSPDGELLVSASDDCTIRVWRVADLAAESQVLRGHEDYIRHVCFSPDGKLLASSSVDNTVRIWQIGNLDVESQVLRSHENTVGHVCFSPDGRLLASASLDTTVRVWQVSNLNTEPCVLRGHKRSISHVCFSPDSRLLVSACIDNTIQVWSTNDLSIEPKVLKGLDSGVFRTCHVCFSPDNKLLASPNDDNTVRVWQVDNLGAEPEVLRGHEGYVRHVCFSPDSKALASGSTDNTVRIWQAGNLSAESKLLSGHEDSISYVCFSPDGRLLASASWDSTVRIMQTSNVTTEPQVLSGYKDAVSHLSFSPDGKLLASASWDSTVRVFQAGNLSVEPQVLQGHGDLISHMCFSPDGRLLASASFDNTVRVWQVDDLGAQPYVLRGHNDRAYHVCFSPDGRLLASASFDNTVRVWQVSDLNAEPHVLGGYEDWVYQVCFSPNGKLLALAGFNNKVYVWRTGTLRSEPQVLRGHEGYINHVCFSPSGELLVSASYDKTVCVWRVGDLTAEPHVLRGHEDSVRHIAFSPDGKLLASASLDNTIRVWQVDDLNAQPKVLRGHEDWAYHVCFSPDGKLLASASYDNTIRMWQVDKLDTEPQVLRGHEDEVFHIAFSPDSRLLASASRDKTVRVWRTDINDVVGMIEGECYRNLSWDEWQTYIGKDIPYEKTIPYLPAGEGVPPEYAD